MDEKKVNKLAADINESKKVEDVFNCLAGYDKKLPAILSELRDTELSSDKFMRQKFPSTDENFCYKVISVSILMLAHKKILQLSKHDFLNEIFGGIKH